MTISIVPSSPGTTLYRMGPTIQPMACAAPLNMGLIQRGMGAGMLNASRTPIDQVRTRGVSGDDAVFLVGQRNLPKTGYARMDRAIDKFADAADYIPQATEDAMTTSVQWGLAGSLGAFATTVLTQALLSSRKMLIKSSNERVWKKLMLALPVAYGAFVGSLAGMGGFAYSFIQNFRDFHRHAAKTAREQKTRARFAGDSLP